MKTTGLGILLALFLAILPFTISQSLFTGSITSKYFLILSVVDLVLLTCAYLTWTGKGGVKKGIPWLLLSLLGVIGIQYLSSFLGVYAERSLWSDLIRQTGVIFLTHLVALSVALSVWLTEKDWTLVRRTVAVTGGIFGFLLIIGVEGFGLVNHFLWTNLGISGYTLGNSTFAGTYLLVSLFVAGIELARSWQEKKWRSVLTASVVLILVSPALLNIQALFGKIPFAELLQSPTLLLGSARASSATAYAALLFVLAVLASKQLIPARARVGMLLGWSLVWLVGIVGALGLLFTPGSLVQDAYIENSSSARLFVWSGAWTAITERPLVGWGPENFNHAFESHFDNRLYLSDNYGEVWFDRAHNVFFDVLVTTGALGLLSFVLLCGALYVVVWRALRKKKIGFPEALLLFVFPVAHALELQTGFDTITSYTLLALLGGYILFLERETTEQGKEIAPQTRKVLAVLICILALVSLKVVALDQWTRAKALYNTFALQDVKMQTQALTDSLTRTSDFELLRLSSASFTKGALAQVAQSKEPQKVITTIHPYLDTYEDAYKAYLEADPTYYRARMNYAYLLLTRTALGEKRLDDARAIIESSYVLSPGNPLTYALHALIELYSGNLKEAEVKIDEAIALNPDIKFSNNVKKHIIEQSKRFPRISILKLENL